ncbi:hypothetical protein RugamoR64_35590 [Duganella rhizosphaerae]|uniref:hypothetical protein n=1 Tax=Duganella rhizosphaerae TaxID=2885763 RepID=UPI0030E84DDA
MKKTAAVLVLGLVIAVPATADFEASLKALQVHDYATALAEARQGQASGDARASYLVFMILSQTALHYLDAAGKPDMARYFQLAARPVAERALDVEAFDALYRAAATGFPPAVLGLAAMESGVVGEGNRARMLGLLQAVPPQQKQLLAGYERAGQLLDRLGQSHASPRLFIDTLELAQVMAAAKACPPGPAIQPVKLLATAISTPPHDTIYLPSTVPGYEHAFLIAGQWQEEWTFQACGKTVALKIDFSADGLGGANMRTDGQAARVIEANDRQ